MVNLKPNNMEKLLKFNTGLSTLIFIIILLTFGSCNQDGPCESPLKWKIESVNTSDIKATINKHDVHINVYGNGTIMFKCKNKKEKILSCIIKINDEWQNHEDSRNSEFKNSFASVVVNQEDGTATMSFKDLPETDTSMVIYVQAFEVETPFYVDIKVR